MTRDIEALVSQLSLDEKAAMTAGADLFSTVAVDRLGIPSVRLTDGPNGARGAVLPPAFGGGTVALTSVCLPCGTALGASWDIDLVERLGVLLGHEARLKGCRILLAPTVNLHRSPLGGRNFESFSEDPLLAGRLAAALVAGVQSQGVVATVKHLVGNESEFERMTMDSSIEDRALRELYLLPFELAVRDGGALGIMTAYNRVNGTFGPNNQALLAGMVRGEWGFDGIVMSDWFALGETEAAANAGLDLEMPGPGRFYGAHLAQAVRDGMVDETVVDAAVARLLSVLDRVGALDDAGDEPGADDRPQDRILTREAAASGIVLLKNDGVLPLDPSAVKTLAVLGPNANRAVIMGGGSAEVSPHYLASPLDALVARLGAGVEVLHEAGVDPAHPVGPRWERAVALAARADAVVVVVGTDASVESEGHDRQSMDLPWAQDELVEKVVAVCPDAVIVVNAGSPVTMGWSDQTRALMQIWFGGQEMGAALAGVIFGDAEPGGRLPVTVPLRLEHNPTYGNFPAENGRIRYSEGLQLGYRWYDARHLPTRFSFGHGLSYTTFSIGPPVLSSALISAGGRLVVEVPVRNVGHRRGCEVVQCYVAPLAPARWRPPKELKAFAKVWLDPGQATTVSLTLDERAFAYWDPGEPDADVLARRLAAFAPWNLPLSARAARPGWIVDAGRYELYIGRSSADIAHVTSIAVSSRREER